VKYYFFQASHQIGCVKKSTNRGKLMCFTTK
jgi:hypothetical protein